MSKSTKRLKYASLHEKYRTRQMSQKNKTPTTSQQIKCPWPLANLRLVDPLPEGQDPYEISDDDMFDHPLVSYKLQRRNKKPVPLAPGQTADHGTNQSEGAHVDAPTSSTGPSTSQEPDANDSMDSVNEAVLKIIAINVHNLTEPDWLMSLLNKSSVDFNEVININEQEDEDEDHE